MRCLKCSKEVPAESQFCPHCGDELISRPTTVKRCPFCAEEIQGEAIVCRFCGKTIVGTSNVTAQSYPPPQSQSQKKSAVPWSVGCITIALVVFGGLSLVKNCADAREERLASKNKAVAPNVTPDPPSPEQIKALHDSNKKLRDNAARLTRALRREHDKVQDVTFYYDPTSPRGSNQKGFLLYIGTAKKTPPWLRLRIQYYGSDWLFIQKYILKIDGEMFTITPGSVDRDNYTDIWEWSDEAATQPHMVIARAVADSKETILRYEGRQYYRDRTISGTEKKALARILEAYGVMMAASTLPVEDPK